MPSNILAQDIPEYEMMHIPLPDVYGNRNIRDICQDHLGVLWIGGLSGLYMYDGGQAIAYQPTKAEHLKNQKIIALSEDSEGNLWMATMSGLYILSQQRDKLLPPKVLGIPDSVSKAANFYFCEGHRGSLMILAGKHIYTYQNKTLTLWRPIKEDMIHYFGMFYCPKKNQLYLMDHINNNLIVYHKEGAAIEHIKLQNENGSPFPSGIAETPWVVTRAFADTAFFYIISGLDTDEHAFHGRLDIEKKTITIDYNFPYKTSIPVLVSVRNFLSQQPNLQAKGQRFGNLKMNTLRDGTWALATTMGLVLARQIIKRPFNHVKTSSGHKIRAINSDKYGHLIYGTYKGIFWHKKEDTIAHHIPVNTIIWTISPINSEKDRFIAEGEDIYKRLFMLYSTPKKVILEKIDSSLRIPGVRSWSMTMAYDSKHNGYWHTIDTARDDKIAFFDVRAGRSITMKPRYSDISARAMVVRGGDLWLGGLGGLRRIHLPDPSFGILSDASNTILPLVYKESLNALYTDKNENIWIGSNSNGLIRYHPEKNQYEQFTTTDGLSEKSVYSILAEPNDSILWLGTGNGLSCFNMNQRCFVNYYTQDGLADNEFNTSAAYFAPDGTIYMGGENGITYFRPESLKTSEIEIRQYAIINLTRMNPAQEVQQIIVGDQTRITVASGTQLIDVSFKTDQYLDASKLQFRYRIPGLIDVWQYLNYTDKALFPKLPPGIHHIEVQVKSPKGMWSDKAQYTLDILPMWYETWWFRAFVLLALAGGLYALYRLRIRQLRREFDLRHQISHDLHDSLGSRLYLLRALGHQIANHPLIAEQDKKAQLDHFETITQDTFKSIRDFIWAFDPRQDDVNQLFSRMDDFAENYLSPLVSTLNIVRPNLNNGIKIGPRVKHHLINIYQEILTNMIKHTRSKVINIELNIERKTIIIQIQNLHEGYQDTSPKDQSTHKMGKDNLKFRLEEIGGLIEWTEPNRNEQVVIIKAGALE
jgi:ligand-binding sensor domain-containing protein/signal transduction histidine kinase